MGKSKDYGWEWKNTTLTQEDRASMTHNDSWGLSPKFYIPSGKTVTVSVNVYACRYSLAIGYNPYLYLSASSAAVKSGISKNITKGAGGDPAAGLNKCELYQYTGINFTDSVSNLSVYAYSSKGTSACAVFFAKCEILYQ